MALQFVITGFLYIAAAVLTDTFASHVRNLEAELPDHDQMEKVNISAAG